MITRMNAVSVYVADQNRSRDFYANQLGFEVLMDAPIGQGRVNLARTERRADQPGADEADGRHALLRSISTRKH
jgi:catechol 2,3-dioxygenase-like lactoylglutathione lyase family enzyme